MEESRLSQDNRWRWSSFNSFFSFHSTFILKQSLVWVYTDMQAVYCGWAGWCQLYCRCLIGCQIGPYQVCYHCKLSPFSFTSPNMFFVPWLECIFFSFSFVGMHDHYVCNKHVAFFIMITSFTVKYISFIYSISVPHLMNFLFMVVVS